MKLLAVLIAAAAVMLAATFGTLSPCGILREVERKQDSLAAVLPDIIVDTALAAKYGSLTPGKCVGLLLAGSNKSGPAPALQTAMPAGAPSIGPADDFRIALEKANAVMGECRDKRLRGELKTYLQSVQCSNPRVRQIFSATSYRYMDLVEFLISKRTEAAKRQDAGQMTQEQAATEAQKLFAQIAQMERSRDVGRN